MRILCCNMRWCKIFTLVIMTSHNKNTCRVQNEGFFRAVATETTKIDTETANTVSKK